MTNNKIPPPLEETAYAKGENFEKMFAEFMKSDLSWNKYVIRSQQKGKRNSKGSQVDIIGERQDKRGKRLAMLALVYMSITVIIMIIGIADNIEWLIYFAAIFSIGGLVAAIISRRLHKENAWVECKNRKTKSTYEDVKKSIDEYKDYEATGDKEFKYSVHYFVSANGFVENALKLAAENNLICYELKNGKFEIVTFWK